MNPNVSVPRQSIDLCNSFLRELTSLPKVDIGHLKGTQNIAILKLFVGNLGNIDNFNSALQKSGVDRALQQKAITLGTKYYKLHAFKNDIGGQKFYDSPTTNKLAGIYEKYLNHTIDKPRAVFEMKHSKMDQMAVQRALQLIEVESQQKPQFGVQPLPVQPVNAGVGAHAQPKPQAPVHAQKPVQAPIKGAARAAPQPLKAQAAIFPSAQRNSFTVVKPFYAGKPPIRSLQEFKTNTLGNYYDEQFDTGGAANVGADIYRRNPQAIIGVMIAGNHGSFGGALGKKNKRDNINENDLKMQTQEESIWGNAVLSKVGTDKNLQKAYYEQTQNNLWGMKEEGGTSGETIQKINYQTTQNASDYNMALTIRHCELSRVDNQKRMTQEKFPAILSFTAGPNVNKEIGTPEGTMKRTLNELAHVNYNFFCECIKEALRASLDGMSLAGVTHALVAPLSCGIYAGPHKQQINQDFPRLLNEVLTEAVGQNGEMRGQYFAEIIMPRV